MRPAQPELRLTTSVHCPDIAPVASFAPHSMSQHKGAALHRLDIATALDIGRAVDSIFCRTTTRCVPLHRLLATTYNRAPMKSESYFAEGRDWEREAPCTALLHSVELDMHPARATVTLSRDGVRLVDHLRRPRLIRRTRRPSQRTHWPSPTPARQTDGESANVAGHDMSPHCRPWLPIQSLS